MKEVLRKYIFLILSLICFSVSAILWFNYNTEDIPYRDKQEVKAIRKQILLHLDRVKAEAEAISQRIENGKKVTFTALGDSYNYPCYVFKNGKLVYWSDFRFVPTYEELRADTLIRYLNLRTGKYISCRKALQKDKDHWEVFTLFNLYRQYPIKNHYINSGLNKDVFGNVFLRISETSLGPESEIKTREGQYLFSLDLSVHSSESSRQELLWVIIASFSLGVLLLLIYMMSFFDELNRWLSTDWSLILFIVLLVGIRSIMLYFAFPYSLVEMELFNPRYYASSWVSPSLGDLLFNVLFYLLITWSVYKNYYRLDSVRWIIAVRRGVRPAVISIVMIVLAYFALYSVYDQLYVIYNNSQWVIDISQSLEFDLFKVTCLIIFVLVCFCFFVWSHLFYRIFLELNPRLKTRQIYLLIIAFLLTIVLSWVIGIWSWMVYLCFVVYSLIILNFSLPNILSKLKYDSYLYFLSSSVICAVLGVYALYMHQENINIINKEKFASQVFVDNDLYGEYLLKHASERIEQDEFLKNTLESPFASKQLIVQKIKKVYLPRYFDRYDLVINIYDAEGTSYSETNSSNFILYKDAISAFKKTDYSTDYDKVYFIKGTRQNMAKSYVVMTDIVRQPDTIGKVADTLGHVLIQLKHKRIVPNNVFPELLVDRQFAQPADNNSYNYAVYTTDQQLLYNFGPYNYDKKFDMKWMSNPALYKLGLKDRDYHHLAVKSGDDKVIIVTSERFSFYRIFANFSFLFLILVLFIGLFLGYAVYFRFDQINFSYATRIQFYLNVAFFLPLIIVSITTLSIISTTYSDSLNKSFIETAEDLSMHLATFMDEQQKYSIAQEKVEEELLEMAQYTHTDINIFDTKGKLSFTTQPAIYENNLLSAYINPMAYEAIAENRSNSVMLNESVGKLNYNCAYVAVRSYQSGRMLGIISIPFFESKVEMDRQIIGVMTTILNIFTATFLVILILSYVVSRLLTEPIRIIAQKIRRTTLGENEPIEWGSNDEIGMLVSEYNEMLVKLEQSRQALSKSEKESAWREMAKQVAHEIKNPLTPMKLAIQHLQKTIKEKRDNAEQLTEKTLHTLLDQVNTLSEIATSFSAFAKMPIPKLEPYNITRAVSNTVNLYTNRTDMVVNSAIPDHEVMVMGDEQLMNGIITNLILNGMQSVPSSRTPQIEITLTHNEANVFIEVKDNGSGIPDSIKDKVFLPNFSTKYTGSGIGLAVAKRGVEHAGGRIWFETEEEQGTSFYIELPLLR